ncbi:macro domain-containing protein [Kineococcus sp. SYSU DK006]|uniref:macro domain-containing protein n=1 Tax=Kineococcus sp. SYSU DK006 TaxID=3383127 RepID=UPI003D7E0FCA
MLAPPGSAPDPQMGLKVADYRHLIDLGAPLESGSPQETSTSSLMTAPEITALGSSEHLSQEELATVILGLLADQDAATRSKLSIEDLAEVPADQAAEVLRVVLTVRPAEPLPAAVDGLLATWLHRQAQRRAPVDPRRLQTLAEVAPGTAYPVADRTALWRGDITTLAADAIVNAANSALLGCFHPGHACIDNAIHAAAGPGLRADCATIMAAQGYPEPTGTAKVTRGHHLPARYVLHTVGPIVDGPLQQRHERALTAAYRSCLDVAAEVGARTVAFCSISTGVFGYPKAPAAHTALTTVAEWLQARPGVFDLVVFDVFSPSDENLYLDAVTSWS